MLFFVSWALMTFWMGSQRSEREREERSKVASAEGFLVFIWGRKRFLSVNLIEKERRNLWDSCVLWVSKFEIKQLSCIKTCYLQNPKNLFGMWRLTWRMFFFLFSARLPRCSLYWRALCFFPENGVKKEVQTSCECIYGFCVPNSFNIIHGSFFRF